MRGRGRGGRGRCGRTHSISSLVGIPASCQTVSGAREAALQHSLISPDKRIRPMHCSSGPHHCAAGTHLSPDQLVALSKTICSGLSEQRFSARMGMVNSYLCICPGASFSRDYSYSLCCSALSESSVHPPSTRSSAAACSVLKGGLLSVTWRIIVILIIMD